MAQNIISKLENKQQLTNEEKQYLDEVRQNPQTEAYKELWLAGLL